LREGRLLAKKERAAPTLKEWAADFWDMEDRITEAKIESWLTGFADRGLSMARRITLARC
jgi:hypothetical protein